MQKIPQGKKKKISSIFFRYGLHLWLMVFLMNVGLFYVGHFFTRATTCFTTAQVQSDSRCLYIWSGQVFEKGTRSSPHQGNPCGKDVTSIIPGSHIANQARYLLPNNVGNICTATQPTATPVPTKAPTPTPTKVPTPTPTRAPGVTPTVTPVPTHPVGATNTPVPTQGLTPSATPAPTAPGQPSATPTTQVIVNPTATTGPVTPLVGPGISFAFRLPGIGQASSNFSPAHTSRQIMLYLYTSNADLSNPGTTPVFTIGALANYVTDSQNPALGGFAIANFDLGLGIGNGTYQIAFKTPQSIKTLIKDSDTAQTGTLFQLTAGTLAPVSPIVNTVLMGDINNDNTIDILDYNLLVDCYGAKSAAPTCSAAGAADLNDDGVIDGIDYNTMLRGIAGLLAQGKTPTLQDANQTPSPSVIPSLTPTPVPKVGMDHSKIVLARVSPTQPPPTQIPQATTKKIVPPTPTSPPKPSLFAAANAVSMTKAVTYLSFVLLIAISLLGAFKSRLITALVHRGDPKEEAPAKKG